jgi:copper(I)-binding protein
MNSHHRSRRALIAGIAGAGVLLAGAWSGASAQPSPVTVAGAWARATPPHAATGAIYLTLTSAAIDRLVAVATPVAAQAEVHRTIQQGGVMEMRPVPDGLALPAGKPVVLAPGGYHIMLTGLKAPLQAGQTIPLHLTFAKAPPVDVMAEVRPLGASGPAMPGMAHGMKMD